MKNRSQTGFAVVEALLVVVILTLISGTGYYVWHSQKSTEKALLPNTSTVTVAKKAAPTPVTVTKEQQYLTISEWGVKMPLTAGISDAYYIQRPNLPNVVYLSKAAYKGTACAADDTSLGAIQRFTASDKDDSGHTLISDFPQTLKVGSYYYLYQGPQAACSTQPLNSGATDISQSDEQKITALRAEFNMAAKHIVAAQ